MTSNESQGAAGHKSVRRTSLSFLIGTGLDYIIQLWFADGVVILAKTLGDLKTILNDLSRVFQQEGLRINMSKTKIMSNAHDPL
ncbi:jg6354 [Pararge aegeria aegeria]|uniref:Jg6354 protein n=1 Tax=Pararge aegeria aegeria TaxID=348720 RepID=A0A8S4RPM4_9NEOP|nr:jg6354 [Pararge aegeria aegeria]